MREEGIDLTTAKPQFLSEELARQATLLVTMGCGDACPYVPGLKKIDWLLTDPKGQSIETVRKIRDEIRQWVANSPLDETGSESPRSVLGRAMLDKAAPAHHPCSFYSVIPNSLNGVFGRQDEQT